MSAHGGGDSKLNVMDLRLGSIRVGERGQRRRSEYWFQILAVGRAQQQKGVSSACHLTT